MPNWVFCQTGCHGQVSAWRPTSQCSGLSASLAAARCSTIEGMRLTSEQIKTIKQATADIFGEEARVRLFGSRVDDEQRGGDVDLLVETDQMVENVAWLAARLSARVSRGMHGRRVDV